MWVVVEIVGTPEIFVGTQDPINNSKYICLGTAQLIVHNSRFLWYFLEQVINMFISF